MASCFPDVKVDLLELLEAMSVREQVSKRIRCIGQRASLGERGTPRRRTCCCHSARLESLSLTLTAQVGLNKCKLA